MTVALVPRLSPLAPWGGGAGVRPSGASSSLAPFTLEPVRGAGRFPGGGLLTLNVVETPARGSP